MTQKGEIAIWSNHSDIEKALENSRALSTIASMNRIIEKAETPKLSYSSTISAWDKHWSKRLASSQ